MAGFAKTGCFDTICTAASQNRCDSSATCMLCRLEPLVVSDLVVHLLQGMGSLDQRLYHTLIILDVSVGAALSRGCCPGGIWCEE